MSDVFETAKRELAEHTLDPTDPCQCEWCDVMRYILSTAAIVRAAEALVACADNEDSDHDGEKDPCPRHIAELFAAVRVTLTDRYGEMDR